MALTHIAMTRLPLTRPSTKYGFAIQEASLPFDSPEEAVQVAHDIIEQAPAGDYPYLAELATERVLQGDYHFGDEFEVGLDLLLDSLERAIER